MDMRERERWHFPHILLIHFERVEFLVECARQLFDNMHTFAE